MKKKYIIEPGDTFHGIVGGVAKIRLTEEQLPIYVKHCKSKVSKLPNVLYPGDELEIPSKLDWEMIKVEEGIE